MTPARPRRRVVKPTFSPVEATSARSLEILRRVQRLPQNPTKLGAWHLPLAVRTITDYVTRAPPWLAKVRGRITTYPAPFRKVHYRSWDGTLLTAWLGVHKAPQPEGPPRVVPREAILVVPGMFNTKDNVLQRDRAVRFFQEWGYHVLVLDLRGMGESSRVFNTAGWKESEDVEASIEYFRAHVPIQKLHVYSESMGAVAAILAAARQAERGFRLVDGGLLAISPFPDAKKMIHHLVHGPAKGEASALLQWFFNRLLRLGGRDYPDFEAYLRAAAKNYQVSLETLYRRSTALGALKTVNVPLLLVCALDDPLVPRSEIRRFERALKGRDNPALLTLPWGGHCVFELQDKAWFNALLQEFFDFYCLLPRAKRE